MPPKFTFFGWENGELIKVHVHYMYIYSTDSRSHSDSQATHRLSVRSLARNVSKTTESRHTLRSCWNSAVLASLSTNIALFFPSSSFELVTTLKRTVLAVGSLHEVDDVCVVNAHATQVVQANYCHHAEDGQHAAAEHEWDDGGGSLEAELGLLQRSLRFVQFQ